MRALPAAATRGLVVILMTIAAACASLGRRPPRPDLKPVSFSLLEDYDKGESLAEVARDFDLFRELGITTWRGSFGWDDYEPTPGRYDFDWLHRFADLAASRGITLRPYIAYTPAWASAGGTDADVWNDPPKDVETWHRFVRTLASEMRRHRNIVSYEIYNEENVRQWWDGSPEAYREVLRRGADAVEAGNPDAELLIGGMVYPDTEWITTMCEDPRSGRRVDVIPFHAYPETWTPPGVSVETYLGPTFPASFVEPADAACGAKPLWINEAGYATTPGRSEADQARWWTRAVATFLAQPRVEHIGVYEIKDLRPDRPAIGDAPNYHLGLTTVDRRKKMAFGTVARLVSLIGTEGIAVERAQVLPATAGTDVHHQLFRRGDGRYVLFVWTRRSGITVDVRVPAELTRAVEHALNGSVARELTLSDGVLAQIALQPDDPRLFELSR